MTEERVEKKERSRATAAIVVIALLALLSAVLTALYVTAKSGQSAADERYRALAESTYRKSYYALLYNMDGLEGATNKLTVASGKALKQEYLADIGSYATAAAENMSDFTPEDAGEGRMLKFINQTGDFAKYLDDKLNKGGSFSETDVATIEEIADSVREIKGTLSELSAEVEEGDFSFVDSLREKDGVFSRTLRSFEQKDVDYPSMIYDGPFSDSLSVREAKALVGADISEEDCVPLVARLLGIEKTSAISVKNGSKSYFETYDCEADTPHGKAYVTLAKKGGFPVSVALPEDEQNALHVGSADAERIAESYLREIGFNNMKAVWASLYDNVYYVNLASERDGVILYPDLIKVKIGGDDGNVVGMESLNYVYNHVERTLPVPVVTEQEAAEAISEYIVLSSCRLALVPTKGGGEALTYEFYGTKGEDKYFVYVDALSGEELKIMRVLDGERGLLLQ